MQGGFVSGFRGVCYLASMGLAALFWHMVNQSRAWTMSWWGDHSNSPGVSGSTARRGDTAWSSPPPCQAHACSATQACGSRPSQRSQPRDFVLFWRAGELFAGTSYEQMRQLRSLSLRPYVLWRGKNKSVLKTCRSFTKHLFREIWPIVVHPLCHCGCPCRALHDVSLSALSLAWSLFSTELVQAPHGWDPAASALPHAHLLSPACHLLQPRKTSAK